jgi:hypothetical protein
MATTTYSELLRATADFYYEHHKSARAKEMANFDMLEKAAAYYDACHGKVEDEFTGSTSLEYMEWWAHKEQRKVLAAMDKKAFVDTWVLPTAKMYTDLNPKEDELLAHARSFLEGPDSESESEEVR